MIYTNFMKKKLKIFSSSSLAFKSNLWRNLRNSYNVNTHEFINIELINNYSLSSDLNIFIIFINDILDDNNSASYNEILKNFKKNIKKLAIKNNSKIIFSFVFRDLNNPINFTKIENKKALFFEKIKKIYFQKVKKTQNLNYFDLNYFFSEEGFNKVYDERNWYSFRLRLGNFGLSVLTQELNNYLMTIFHPRKKVIILDCDNTLWGGVVGEDKKENLTLGTDGEGKAFQDFQKTIKRVANSGILLCLASKNNSKDVWDVFKNHPEMVLKKNDITHAEINWDEKWRNIIKISKKLSLSLDSFVFIDDNPLEREKIKKFIPEVEVLNMRDDVSFWQKDILKERFFANINSTKEDKKKTKQYSQKIKFDREKEKTKNNVKFLKNLKINYRIEKINKFHLARASQMTLKTNQFNFTSKRYSVNELKSFIHNKKTLSYILRLKDKYGDHGYVSLIMINKLSEKTFIIDNFLTSCRILGRDIELTFLEKVVQNLKKKCNCKILLKYQASDKNYLALQFIKKNKLKQFIIKKNNSEITKTKKSKLFNLAF